MSFDDLNNIPDWDFEKNREEDEEAEEWKNKPKRDKAQALYNQGKQVYVYAKAFCESLTGEMAETTKSLIMQNVIMICPKIVGAEAGDSYVIRMENASVIRTNCRELIVQVGFAGMCGQCNKDYEQVVRSEMEKFRLLFIDWVSLFEKDEFEDEWGLYL
jgi:bacterioferritin-associated ferredoxin